MEFKTRGIGEKFKKSSEKSPQGTLLHKFIAIADNLCNTGS